jgi:hypothetical protein
MTLRQLPRRRPAPDDDGAALIMALVFVTAIGLVVGALLSYGAANVRASTAMRERAQADYDVDGALQTAVNTIRTSGYNNAPGQQCFDGSGTFTYSGDVAVACMPKPDTGAAGGQTRVDERNKPTHALLTVGEDTWFRPDSSFGEPGIGQVGDHTLEIHGNVHTNSGIALFDICTIFGNACARMQQTDPDATVSATNYCGVPLFMSTILSAGGLDCRAPVIPDPGQAGQPRADAYAQPSVPAGATVFTAENTPKCNSGTGSTVSLVPGVYTDSKPLNDLTNCTQKIILFTPGVYFFDFRNGERGQPAAGGTDAKVWKVNNPNATIVGGTPRGWSPNAGSKPAVTMPGSCVSPRTSATPGTGVEFVFGGDSRLEVRAGSVELCGQWHRDRPPIVVYGAKADATETLGAGQHATATSTTTPAFTDPSRIRPEDGDEFATAAFDTRIFQTATAKLMAEGFVPSPAPPPGSILRSATLTVRERIRSGGRGSMDAWKAAIRMASGSERHDVTLDRRASNTWRQTPIDLMDGALEQRLIAAVANGTFSGLKVEFEATAGWNTRANADVESVELELGWLAPIAIRGQRTDIDDRDNCVGTPIYVPAPSIHCALLKTSGNAVRMYVDGTIYAPWAAVDIGLSGNSRANFSTGIIARSFRTDLAGWTQREEPLIEVPEDSTGPSDLIVHLNAYVCRESAACGSGPPPTNPAWTLSGQAKVKYGNDTEAPATSRPVTVETWRIMR